MNHAILSYKYRIYPNKKQAEGLDFMLWQMRTVYNDALNERKWYATLMIDVPTPRHTCGFGQVGIDMGINYILATSDGGFVENPRLMREAQRKLRVAQRALSRKKRGGHNRRKAVYNVARLHEKVANQRLDFWHKETRKIIERHNVVCIEALPLAFMTRGTLAKSAHDAGLGMFKQLLSSKAEEAGSKIVAVNPKNTSQACSGCGVLVKKGRGVRVHHCSDCGLVLDRDTNAAKNILTLGRSVLGLTCPNRESVPREAPHF